MQDGRVIIPTPSGTPNTQSGLVTRGKLHWRAKETEDVGASDAVTVLAPLGDDALDAYIGVAEYDPATNQARRICGVVPFGSAYVRLLLEMRSQAGAGVSLWRFYGNTDSGGSWPAWSSAYTLTSCTHVGTEIQLIRTDWILLSTVGMTPGWAFASNVERNASAGGDTCGSIVNMMGYTYEFF